MLLDTLNFLQNLLLPLVLGALVVGGMAVYLVSRKPPAPRRPAARPAERRAAEPVARTPAPAAPPAPAAGPGLPPAPEPAATAARPAPTTPAQPAPTLPLLADLLLVDDSAVVRAKLRRLFEPAGYRVVLARDGEEALALLGQGSYGLMVTDLEMPRLDGVGLIRATQQQPAWAAMPILAITGHEDLQAQLNQLNAVAGIYRKPWLDDDLLGHVQALVQPSAVPAAQTDLA